MEKRRSLRYEATLRSPMYICIYARSLGCRVPALEHFLLDHATWAFSYARDVIKGRWPEAEHVILKNPNLIDAYMHQYIKGRWLEAENVVLSGGFLVGYSVNAIKGRWPKAERTILSHHSTLSYAQCAVEGRWVEAEHLISKTPVNNILYCSTVMGGRWVDISLTTPEDYFKYASCIGSRVPKCESLEMTYEDWVEENSWGWGLL